MDNMEGEVKRKLLEELMAMTSGMSGDRLPKQKMPMGRVDDETDGENGEQEMADLYPRLIAIIREKQKRPPINVGSSRG